MKCAIAFPSILKTVGCTVFRFCWDKWSYWVHIILENSTILGCDAVALGNRYPTSKGNIVFSPWDM
jgi:hypothetical protein